MSVTSTVAFSAKREKDTPAKPIELSQSENCHLKMIALTRHCHIPLCKLYTCISNIDNTDRYDAELKIIQNTNTMYLYKNISISIVRL